MLCTNSRMIRVLLRLFVLLFLVQAVFSRHDVHSKQTHSIVLVSTLDGHLRAVDVRDGRVKWTLEEAPVLRTPNSVKQGFTFLPNPQDGTLYLLKDGVLKKLPFTIPQLVSVSPCRGSDGVLYAGSKKDVWFGIDPVSGAKMETLSSATTERVCPANQGKSIFIGRTEYRVSMFDTENRGKTWNATFSDYSAHLLPADSSYHLKHYVSSSSGNILAVDNETGQIVWELDLGMPAVAMYLLQDDGLHKLSFTVLGKETMENIVKSALSAIQWNNVLPSEKPTDASLFPTLYVGETSFGLYAINAFVDQHTITYAPKYLGPPLLEGPSPIAISVNEKSKFTPPKRPIVTIEHMPTITHKTDDGEFLLLGYHEPPALHLGSIIPTRFPQFPQFPHIGFKPDNRQLIAEQPAEIDDSLSAQIHKIYVTHPQTVYGVVVAIFAITIAIVWNCGKQSGVASIIAGDRSAQTSRVSNSGKQWIFTNTDDIPDGWMNVGKLLYDPNSVLGRGCEGTVVYRGKFDGRDVAVKRVVSEFVSLVDREADLLRESDAHPHVIRYFCMESDSQFRYLALELCVASLTDYVEKSHIREKIGVEPLEVLRQATDGLTHLHAMDIVHRDMKPQNVLISISGQRGQVRAVISDFGLCKRIQPGRHSLSRRSGMAGTDGWIAPEAFNSLSTGRPVDIFSLGCIFYYVLTEGAHPFGDNLHRQANIVMGKYHLKELKDDGDITIKLLESMIQLDPLARPSAAAVLIHPFFWSDEKRLGFLGEVSNRIEKLEDNNPIVRRLEKNAKQIVRSGWRNHICDPLTEDLRKFRTYKSHSVKDLIRAMRNKKNHYQELPPAVRESLGQIPEQFLHYWTSRFPQLLMHAYESMEWCAHEPVFRHYYHDSVRERMRDVIAQDELERREAQENMNTGMWRQTPEKKAAKQPPATAQL